MWFAVVERWLLKIEEVEESEELKKAAQRQPLAWLCLLLGTRFTFLGAAREASSSAGSPNFRSPKGSAQGLDATLLPPAQRISTTGTATNKRAEKHIFLSIGRLGCFRILLQPLRHCLEVYF